MASNSTDGNANGLRSTKPTQDAQNSKPSERQSREAKNNKSKQDPVNSDETLRRNENGNS